MVGEDTSFIPLTAKRVISISTFTIFMIILGFQLLLYPWLLQFLWSQTLCFTAKLVYLDYTFGMQNVVPD